MPTVRIRYLDTPTALADPATVGLTADTPDDELDTVAARVEEKIRATAEGVVVVEGAREWVVTRREELRQAVRDELAEIAARLEEAKTLRRRRDMLIRRLKTWGDTSRQIADLARMSHPRIIKITKQKNQSASKPASQREENTVTSNTTIADILDRLNNYSGDNIWQDVILCLDAYDETATGTNDQFSLTDGTIIRYDVQTGRWHVN